MSDLRHVHARDATHAAGATRLRRAADAGHGQAVPRVAGALHAGHAAALRLLAQGDDQMGARHMRGYQVCITIALILYCISLSSIALIVLC